MDEAVAQPSKFFDACGTQLTLEGDVLFDLNSFALRPESMAPLRRLGDLLRPHKGEKLTLVLVGHTDPRGTERLNDQLSLSRAKRVRDFLVAQGAIDRKRTRIEGRGKREPIYPATAPEEKQRFNRRVDVSVACPPSPGGGSAK
jgi:outer membrane protein OmpA-like peptidoglycan-associated protein